MHDAFFNFSLAGISIYMLRGLNQTCMNTKIRATAFAAFGALSSFAVGAQHEIFLEQVPYLLSLCDWGTDSLDILSDFNCDRSMTVISVIVFIEP